MNFSSSKSYIISSLSLTAFALLGCQNAALKGPSNNNVKGKLTFELPEYIAVQSLDVHALENFGSEVDPLIRARFSANAKLSEPLYLRVADYMNTDVIRIQSKAGTPITITGKYSATMQGNAWQVSFEDLDAAPNPSGRTLSNWSVGSYVISGSSEEKELIANEKKAAEEREAERKAAEVRRVKAEEERKRAALAERKKTAATEARLAEESKMAQREAAAIQSAAEASFRRTVAGTWNPVGSIIDRNGDVYSNGRDKIAISMRFTLPQSQYNKFVVPLTIYASEYPTAQFTTDATVTLDAKSNKVSIAFPGSKKVKMACVTKPERECVYYESLGNPWTGIVNNGEVKLTGGRNRTITLRK